MAVSVEAGQVDGRLSNTRLSWSVAQAPKSDDSPNGDGYLLKRDGDVIVFALVDGVGSGHEAHRAALACLRALSECRPHDLKAAFETCNTTLNGTRGAALGLALFDLVEGRLQWAAIGDVDGCVFRPGAQRPVASMVQRGGTLGHMFSGLHVQSHSLQSGDLIALCSDGVSRKYRDAPPDVTAAASFAATCLDAFGRRNDDRTFAALTFERAAA